MKTLNKSLNILKLFLKDANEKTLDEITKLSGVNKTSVIRIISTFVNHGFLKQRKRRGKYSLGSIYFDFTSVLKRNLRLRDVAVPYLAKLSKQLNESVIIAYGDGREGVITETFQDMSRRNTILRVVPAEGSDMQLHSTSLGKILLANMPEKALETYFSDETVTRFTPNTITDLNSMRSHLLPVREEDVAFDDEEFSLGVRGVAAGLRDNEGMIIGAIAVIAPTVRLTRSKMQELRPVIKNCALEISRELGFKE